VWYSFPTTLPKCKRLYPVKDFHTTSPIGTTAGRSSEGSRCTRVRLGRCISEHAYSLDHKAVAAPTAHALKRAKKRRTDRPQQSSRRGGDRQQRDLVELSLGCVADTYARQVRLRKQSVAH